MAIEVYAGTVAINTVAGTTLNVPYPTTAPGGIVSTDLLVVGFSVSTTTAQGVPAGYTSEANFVSTVLPTVTLARKVAAGGESGNLAVTTTSQVSLGQMLLLRNVDLTTPNDVATVTRDQATASGTINLTATTGMTTTRPGVCLVYFAGQNATANTASPPTAPATFTETAERTSGTRTATMGYLLWSSFGSVGSPTITWSGSARSIGALAAYRLSELPMLVMPPRN